MRQWPRESSATITRSSSRSWPTITFLTSNRSRSRGAATSERSVIPRPTSASGGWFPRSSYHRVMAVSAYILIQTEVGKAADVATKVADIEGVVTSEDVTGPYDVIVRAEAETMDDLGRMVVSRVQMIEGITRTLTCTVVHL